jgi:tetratricopeptide (TPR) repeat protein
MRARLPVAVALQLLLVALAFAQAPIAARGCGSAPGVRPPFGTRPTLDPQSSADATRALGGKTSLAFHVARAWYFDGRADELDAMQEFRAAIAAGVAVPQVRVDSLARLPLSVRLFRNGEVAAARSNWQIALGDAAAYEGGDPPTRDWNAWFDDVGAGDAVRAGQALARRGELPAAERAWRLAQSCAGNVPFPPAYALLGDAAAHRGDLDAARRLWLGALDVADETRPIDAWQEDALRGLLRTTSSAPLL